MNITDNFKNTLYEILDEMSVGDVQFGVLKTFYEDDDVHKLYDELFCVLPDDKMQKTETVLQRVGVKMFLYYLYMYRNVVKPFFKDTDDRECVEWARWFDTNIHLNIYTKLQDYSVMEMKFDVAFQGIAHEIVSMSSSFIDGFFEKPIETIGVENLINRLHVIGNDYLDHHIKDILSDYVENKDATVLQVIQ